jgi:hypothetical protein
MVVRQSYLRQSQEPTVNFDMILALHSATARGNNDHQQGNLGFVPDDHPVPDAETFADLEYGV